MDGNKEYSASNIPAPNYTQYSQYTQYSLTYVPLSSMMNFTVLGRNDPGYLLLDDVSVVEAVGEYLSRGGAGGQGG